MYILIYSPNSFMFLFSLVKLLFKNQLRIYKYSLKALKKWLWWNHPHSRTSKDNSTILDHTPNFFFIYLFKGQPLLINSLNSFSCISDENCETTYFKTSNEISDTFLTCNNLSLFNPKRPRISNDVFYWSPWK